MGVLKNIRNNSLEFDLFKLHNKKLDIGNQSWICLNGKNIPRIISELIIEVKKNNHIASTKDLCFLISQKINSNLWSVEQVLYDHKKWVPIPILKELIRLSNNPLHYRKKIIENTSYLKCNSATSKPIKAVKRLNLTLCKLAGAHAADGNLFFELNLEVKNKRYCNLIVSALKNYCKNISVINTAGRLRIKIKTDNPEKVISNINKSHASIFLRNQINLTDGYFNAVLAYKKWIKECFNFDVAVKKHSKKDAWVIDFGNKIIGRYLTVFLGFPNGEKTLTVKEPYLIANSHLKFREAFLIGFLTFEGHVPPVSNRIECISKSRKLIKSIREILDRLQIPIRIRKDKYGRWICNSLSLNKQKMMIARDLFEKNTEKWQRMNEKINGFRKKFISLYRTKEIIKNAYPTKSTSKIDIVHLFTILYEEKLISYSLLKQNLKVNNPTLAKYLNILRKCKILYDKPHRTLVLNRNKSEWRLPSEVYNHERL